jgi:IS5 family transposase
MSTRTGARAGDGKAADEHGVEARPLDQQCAQRVIGAGDDEQPLVRDRAVERLAEAWSSRHRNLRYSLRWLFGTP